MKSTHVETIAPAFAVGDKVAFRGHTGIIRKVYRAAHQAPLWFGTRHIIHTHAYEIFGDDDSLTWGWVDAELERG
jgi:hypothetical protein